MTWVLALTALLATACEAANDRAVVGGNDSETTGQSSDSTDPAVTDTGTDFEKSTDPLTGCAEGTEKIYVVDSNNTFYAFDPTVPGNGAFERIATLKCGLAGQPFSMAVSRDGFAYVLYVKEGGTPFNPATVCSGVTKVNIKTGECLGATPFKCNNAAGFKIFGMGFASDQQGSSSETLYIAGAQGSSGFGILDVKTGDVAKVGGLPPGDPEFTGNGKGELWGFFPSVNPPNITQINKTSGAALTSYKLQGLQNGVGGGTAYAFAYWGDAFYIFYKVSTTDNSTNVWKLDTNGTLSKAWDDTGTTIVGAGVSTCAPTQAQ